jgi:hypothetical protein
LRQRKVVRLAYDSEHGKLWQDIKADLDKTRDKATKFAHDAEWTLGGRTVRVLVAGVLFAVVVALLAVFLNWYVAPTKPSEKKDLVLAVAQILAGTALLLGLYFTWGTLQVNREGQITDRFTRAIDQLGATDDKGQKLEVRLGGIYALERIDKESPERAYHPTVMEVLTAYVRENSRRDHEKPSTPTSVSDEDAEQESPPTDIQTILDVLKRRAEKDVREKHRVENLNLQGAYLRGADLIGADLRGADLQGADLQGADLRGAILKRAIAFFASFQGAILEEADLSDATLSLDVNLQKANLYKANLTRANLRSADLTEALLKGVILKEAILEGANLKEANLLGADLQGADLQGAENLDQTQIEWTIGGDKTTKLPEGYRPAAVWKENLQEQKNQMNKKDDEERNRLLESLE